MTPGPLSRPPIYTLGHDNHDRAVFLSLLTRHGVNMLVDVRAEPNSPHLPHFCRNALAASLKSWGVGYFFCGRELGGRGTSVVDAVSFCRGIDRVIAAWRQAYRLALVCAEEDPRRCHRAWRIAPALLSRGARVVHIRGDGRLEPHTPAWADYAVSCATAMPTQEIS